MAMADINHPRLSPFDERFPPQGDGSKLRYVEAELDPNEKRPLELRFGPQTEKEWQQAIAATDARDQQNSDPDRRLKDWEMMRARLLKEASGA